MSVLEDVSGTDPLSIGDLVTSDPFNPVGAIATETTSTSKDVTATGSVASGSVTPVVGSGRKVSNVAPSNLANATPAGAASSISATSSDELNLRSVSMLFLFTLFLLYTKFILASLVQFFIDILVILFFSIRTGI